MRNLKKVLSLVLALAMSLSLFAVASASYSDFTDADEIDHTEAVAQLVELGVINGKEDGSYFDPNGIVTRAEMAKMITVVLNSGKDPVTGVKDNPTYTDIKGNWAEQYIEYCSSDVGIISGRGDGTFGPNDTVTVQEAAKMLLVTLGYDADIFHLVGSDWAANTNVQANKSELYEELGDLRATDGLTREHAAQMIYNALQAKIMEITYDKVVNGELSYSYKLSETKTLLAEKFNANIYTAIVVATPTASIRTAGVAGKDKTVVSLVEKDGIAVSGSKTFKVVVDDSLLGQEVKLVVKNDTAETVYGNAYATDKNNVVTVANKPSLTNLTNALKDADITEIKNAVLSENGIAKTATETEDGETVTVLATPYATISALRDDLGNGKQVTVIDNNDDGKADVILASRYSVGKVNSYRTTGDGYIAVKNIATGNTAFSSSDPVDGDGTDKVNGFEDVAKDDIVLFYDNAKGERVVIPVDAVDVTVSSKNGDKLTADGKTYEKSMFAAVLNEDNGATTLAGAVAVGDSATLYLDANGYVVYADAEETTKNYLLVNTTNGDVGGDEWADVQAAVVLQDGTKATIKISKVDGTKVTDSDVDAVQENTIYSYTVASDGSYELKPLANGLKQVTVGDISKGNPDIGVAGVSANSKTIFVVSTDNKSYSVYTGISAVTNVKGVTEGFAIDDDGTAKVVFIRKAGSTGEDSTSSIYFLSADPTVTKNGDDWVNTYDVVLDGVKTTIQGTDPTEEGVTATKGTLYLNVNLVDGKVDVDALNKSGKIAAAVDCTSVGNGVISAGTIYTPKGTSTRTSVTYNDSTTVVEIDDKTVNEATIDDIVTTKNADKASQVIIVTGSSDIDKTDYNVADIIYIIK